MSDNAVKMKKKKRNFKTFILPNTQESLGVQMRTPICKYYKKVL